MSFPHAGGWGTSFLSLQPFLPPETHFVILDYPRKRGQPANALPGSVQGLAEYFLNDLRPILGKPGEKTAFFGYSMGGLVAYEAARLLKKEGIKPDILITASMVPPQLQSMGRTRYHLLDDSSFLEAVAKDTGISTDLSKKRIFLKYLFPFLRREVEMAEKYRWIPGERIDCPIICLYGREDKIVFDKGGNPEDYRKEMSLWGDLTSGCFSLHFIEGGHLFMLENPAPGMEVIRGVLKGIGL